jgi:hypothetical protein
VIYLGICWARRRGPRRRYAFSSDEDATAGYEILPPHFSQIAANSNWNSKPNQGYNTHKSSTWVIIMKLNIAATVLFSFLVGAKAEQSEDETQIIGGTQAAAGEFPWYTTVDINSAAVQCGGALIGTEVRTGYNADDDGGGGGGDDDDDSTG